MYDRVPPDTFSSPQMRQNRRQIWAFNTRAPLWRANVTFSES